MRPILGGIFLAILVTIGVWLAAPIIWSEEPVRTYPETTWCGGVQLVTEYPGPQYVVQRLGDCPTLRILGDYGFQVETYSALERLHQVMPEATDFLLRYITFVIQEQRWSGVNPSQEPHGVIWVMGRIWNGIGGWQWYASTLMHEARHLSQYHNGLPWCGVWAERDANDYQADVLERLTAGDEGWQWPWLAEWLRQINHAEYPNYPKCE